MKPQTMMQDLEVLKYTRAIAWEVKKLLKQQPNKSITVKQFRQATHIFDDGQPLESAMPALSFDDNMTIRKYIKKTEVILGIIDGVLEQAEGSK